MAKGVGEAMFSKEKQPGACLGIALTVAQIT